LDAEIGDFGIESDGQALKSVFFDGRVISNSGITIITTPEPDFRGLITSISFDFGNDDPNLTSPGDLAVLRLALAGDIVGQVTKELNRDDAMNQTIEFSGTEFARIEFAYTDASLTPIPVGEVIDNINIEFSTTPSKAVPEPSVILGLSLLAGLGYCMKHKWAG
jgi:hypothetical protein